MSARRDVTLPLEPSEHGTFGHLSLRLPHRSDPFASPPPLLDLRAVGSAENGRAPVQLLESEEYLYEIDLRDEPAGQIIAEPQELFDPDTTAGRRGRLRPGLHTGLLPLSFQIDGRKLGSVELEVRSRKLNYREHYQWMLGDLADGMAELVMQRFAPTEQRFEIEAAADAATLYQRFAFLRSLIESDVFDGAIQQVVRRPYRTWTAEEETRRPGQGIPATSAVSRQLAGPGRRVQAGALKDALGLETVPRRLRVQRTEETRDNVPNRFVRFAFERWRDVVSTIHDQLQTAKPSGPMRRGLRECGDLLDRLDAVLAREVFRTCGRLQSFPTGNQVLQKREGYRDVFRAYIQFEAAARLSWTGGDDVYGAGQRDVATLYEYWVFYTLGREISRLCDEPFEMSDLIESTERGLGLQLKKGQQQILSGTIRRLGRTMDLQFWFNRTFSASGSRKESWTRGMRPDCSLCIGPSDGTDGFFHDEVWLHFDAKYRIDRLEEALGPDASDAEDEKTYVDEEEQSEAWSRAKRADLLKMHAYRDAIRRSSGAYVIYPGTERATHHEYHEVLPGLGAFPLEPTTAGRPKGASELQTFIDEVLDQVALQTSQHERARYWTRRSYRPALEPDSTVQAAPFLDRPPADTLVLLGYVRGDDHHRWIGREGLYNLRAGGRTGSVAIDSEELSARYVVLYGRGRALPEVRKVIGEPLVLDREKMESRSYPSPGGELYFCLPVGPRREYPPLEDASNASVVDFHAEAEGGRRGAPHAVSWQEFLEGLS